VLVTLPAAFDATYASALAARLPDFQEHNCICVITRDRVGGVPTPAALVADKWGEIVHVAAPPRQDDLPSASELLDWVAYVELRCPECEGEAR
jgi:hypothetical protein